MATTRGQRTQTPLADAAGLVTALIAILPTSYVFAVAGLAILGSLQDAFEKAFGGTLRFGAFVALAVAATPISFVGITSAFWAVVTGLAVSLLTERGALLDHWRGGKD